MTPIAADGLPSFDPSFKLFLGLTLVGVLLNAIFSGAVGQQFYTYWISGFRDSDSKCVRSFVVIQFAVIMFQTVTVSQSVWIMFIYSYGRPLSQNVWSWRWPVSSLCQCFLVFSANVFLALRIYRLTKSRLQGGLVITLSSTAFILGIATTIMTWGCRLAPNTPLSVTRLIFTSSQNAASAAWHSLQAGSEALITILLTRVLLKSRSGLRRSDNVVNRIVFSVIQIGLIGTLCALAGLTTWFFLRRTSIYIIFDMTVGSIYTHAVYATLLSRVQLREHLNENSNLQPHPDDISEGQRASSQTKVHDVAISVISFGNLPLATSETPTLRGFLEKDDVESNIHTVG